MRPIVFLLLLLASTAHASWNPNGNPVCAHPAAQQFSTISTDAAGGMYVAWRDARNASTDVYLQRVRGDGTIAPGWPVDGLGLTSGAGAERPWVQPDGAGGALLLWESGSPRDIRVQRVDANGTIHPGWPAGGKQLIPEFNIAQFVSAADGRGGAWFAWNRPAFDHIMQISTLARVDSSGTLVPPFNTAGTTLAQNDEIRFVTLSNDPSGGVVYCLGTRIDAQVDQYFSRVGRVDTSGVITMFSGLPYGQWQFTASGISDGQGGAFAAWTTTNQFPASTGAWAQRFGPAAQKLWPDSTVAPANTALVRDPGTGVFLLSNPTGTARLEAQRRLAGGALAPGWETPIVIAQPATLGAFGGFTTPTGMVVAWAQNGVGLDLRALALDENGQLETGSVAGGSPITQASGDQGAFAMIPTATGGALVAWQDGRTAAGDVYANRIEFDPPLGVPVATPVFALRSIAPNPARDLVRVELALADEAPASLELIDVRGRVLARRAAGASTTLRTDALPAGLYWLRATQGAARAVGRVVVLR